MSKPLTPKEQAEIAKAVEKKRPDPLSFEGDGAEVISFIIDANGAGIDVDQGLLDTLVEKEIIDAYVVLPKLNPDGTPIRNEEYITGYETYVFGIAKANIVNTFDQIFGIRRAELFRAFHFDDFPSWAKLPDGSPAHRFSGIDIKGGPPVPKMKKRNPGRPILPHEE